MRPAVLLVAVSLCWPPSLGLYVDKSTGAYEDIVVAIHPSVEPDERIIDNIKALFRSASTFLHRATRGLVHFGSVTIAVPDTWPARRQAKSTAASLFPMADVRVAAENPQYGDTPYTLQPRGCGERGEYVHLTPRFLGEMNDSIAEAYGSPAYLLVHEWAHFRYGVFDEYGDPESFRYPSLYCEFGMVRASACPARVKFTASTETGEPCRIYKGCRVSTKCKAHFQQSSEDPVTSSIMFMPYLEGVTDFCESTNKTHNIFAPNKHNHLCERKSTWEVISANEDFKELVSTKPDRAFEVKFTEVQKRERALGRVIFALDVSSSMATSDRIVYLKAAASQFIQALLLDGMEVGIVQFNETASVVSALTSVAETSREELVEEVLKLKAGGNTCIGCSLQKSLKMFEENGQRVEGSVIILMTDGEESEAPKIDDVMDELIAAQVVVNTIAFGTQAEEKLEELALRTGGKPFALREGQSNVPVAIESAFLDSAFALLDESKRPVVIFDQQADVAEERKFSILVDADLGNETTVVLQSKEASKLKAVLLYPDGKTCEDCLVSGPAVSGNYVNFKIPGIATPGTWTLVVSQDLGSGEVAVHVRATSLARYPDEKPVMVRAFLKRTEVDSAAQAAVYAEVTKGEYVVLHAKVTATVVRPQGHGTVEMELFDDGLGADVTANDGIYSGYFTQFDGVGRYSVSARVVSGDDSVIVQGRQASGGLPAPQVSALPSGGAPESTDEVDGIPLERFVYVDQDIEEAEPRVLRSEKAPEFERYAEGGSFRLTNEVDDSTIPPNSIQDLKVEDAFMDVNGTHVVILTWTCPGAHMNSDNASQVELRGSTRIVDVINHFDSAFAVSEDYAADGKIPAGAVGSRQRLRFHLADALLAVAKNDSRRDFYFAARVWNDDGLFSPVSNLVRVTFKRPQPHTKGTTWWIISLGVLAAVFVVLALVIVARKIGRWRRTSGSVTSIVA
ncbi:calcium-activated chloride channel regulator 1-like isoform X2 [Dermacentor andersoni]|uniref:calcium-activated chloride channel regulator 1-like isoform X2 n=1 Tax=Dermacentor andersoni TaxID=34620 RepID=UPI003B3B3321